MSRRDRALALARSTGMPLSEAQATVWRADARHDEQDDQRRAMVAALNAKPLRVQGTLPERARRLAAERGIPLEHAQAAVFAKDAADRAPPPSPTVKRNAARKLAAERGITLSAAQRLVFGAVPLDSRASGEAVRNVPSPLPMLPNAKRMDRDPHAGDPIAKQWGPPRDGRLTLAQQCAELAASADDALENSDMLPNAMRTIRCLQRLVGLPAFGKGRTLGVQLDEVGDEITVLSGTPEEDAARAGLAELYDLIAKAQMVRGEVPVQ